VYLTGADRETKLMTILILGNKGGVVMVTLSNAACVELMGDAWWERQSWRRHWPILPRPREEQSTTVIDSNTKSPFI